jgi:hypothetical protein
MSRAYGNGFYGRRQGYLGSPEERGYLGSPEERVYLGSPEERVAGCGGQMVGAPRHGGHHGGRGGWGGYGWPYYGYGGYGYDNYGLDNSHCVYDQRTGRYVCYVWDPSRGWVIVG